MRADLRTAILAATIAFAPHAGAEEVAAAKGCEAADLAGSWILTFQRDAKTEVCFIEVAKKGKVETIEPCFVGTAGVAPYDLGGGIAVEKNCQLLGVLQPSVGSDLMVLARLGGDCKLITGVLADDQENYFAVTGFRWKLEPLRR